ncbi:MAG: protein kinase [Anaerolineales bacterium]|nr:protein kinase [Anaerolineales bacterium]
MSDMKASPKPYAHYTGRQLGIYHVEEMLGRGGMAEVYKSRHPELDRDVAIKILHPHRTDDPNFIERFRREAKMAATLRHPHIVQVYDFAVTEDGLYYMVLEYVDGQSLNLYLEQNAPLPLSKVYALCEQIMSAVQYAHERGIIHRDIKPDNIMIDASGKVYLTDFGIAQMAAVPGLTQSHATIGTPLYMAPEQMRSQPLTIAVDIYSLGMLLYYMVTDHYPYDSETPASLMTLKLTEPPIPPSEFVPDIPPSLEAAIIRSLSIDPGRRFASVEHMRRVLEKSLGDQNKISNSTKVLWNLLGIENYKITKAIPVFPGSLSRRFLAHNIILDQPAVIEVLNTTAERDPELVEAFDQRITALSQIQNPHVAVVTSTGVTTHDEPYVCVEYTGEPLSQKIPEWRQTPNGYTPEMALKLAEQIAGALAAGEKAGLCHNDLCTDNVLYQPDGTVIVAGFEVPQPVSPPSHNQANAQVWLPYYAPEQLANGRVTARSNIYSLGVILYELLVGQRPFLVPAPSGNPNGTGKVPISLSSARPGLAAETLALVNECLQTRPDARPATLAQVEERLTLALKAETRPQPPPVSANRQRYSLWIVGALLLSALLFWLVQTNGGGFGGRQAPASTLDDPATALPALIPVPTLSPTATSSPTAVPTEPPPTATATHTPTLTPTPTWTPTTEVCISTPPASWIIYRVQANDSLSKLAAAANIPFEYLRDVNCLSSIILSIGQQLWVPAGAVTPTPRNTATVEATASPTVTPAGSIPGNPRPTTPSTGPEPTKTPVPPPPTRTPPPPPATSTPSS